MSKNHDNQLWKRVQRGLMEKGYKLPRFGADGEPGKETGNAMLRMINDFNADDDSDGIPTSGPPSGGGTEDPARPLPQPKIIVPRESNSELNKFYGTARANPPEGYLSWFNFPVGDMKLFSRSGTDLKDYDGDGNDEHRCHSRIVESLEAALQDVYTTIGKDEFYRQGWHVYAGCWNYRAKRGGSSLSVHSWGCAVDINPAQNNWKQYSTSFSEDAFDAMERHGFLSAYRAWGHDAMHFQKCTFAYVKSNSHYGRNGYPSWIVEA